MALPHTHTHTHTHTAPHACSLLKNIPSCGAHADIYSLGHRAGDYSDAARSLAALTGIGRTEWAQIRNSHFRSGLNRDSLDVLETALFHVSRTWFSVGRTWSRGVICFAFRRNDFVMRLLQALLWRVNERTKNGRYTVGPKQLLMFTLVVQT